MNKWITVAAIICLCLACIVLGRWTKEPEWEIPRLLTTAEEQRELSRLGFYDGPIDGIRGPLHRQAKEFWEQSYCEEQAAWAFTEIGMK